MDTPIVGGAAATVLVSRQNIVILTMVDVCAKKMCREICVTDVDLPTRASHPASQR